MARGGLCAEVQVGFSAVLALITHLQVSSCCLVRLCNVTVSFVRLTMASTDEWEVSLLVSEIVLAFALLSAVLTFLSAAYAFPATVPVTELADPPEKKTVFAAYPKSFKSLCFIEALATCVASIFLFVFGLDRHAYWLVILPAIWQSLAFAVRCLVPTRTNAC